MKCDNTQFNFHVKQKPGGKIYIFESQTVAILKGWNEKNYGILNCRTNKKTTNVIVYREWSRKRSKIYNYLIEVGFTYSNVRCSRSSRSMPIV